MTVETDALDMERMENGLLVPTRKGLAMIHDRIIAESLDGHNEGHYGIRDDSILD